MQAERPSFSVVGEGSSLGLPFLIAGDEMQKHTSLNDRADLLVLTSLMSDAKVVF